MRAAYQLGQMHVDGVGVAMDFRMATYWFTMKAVCSRGNLTARKEFVSLPHTAALCQSGVAVRSKTRCVICTACCCTQNLKEEYARLAIKNKFESLKPKYKKLFDSYDAGTCRSC